MTGEYGIVIRAFGIHLLGIKIMFQSKSKAIKRLHISMEFSCPFTVRIVSHSFIYVDDFVAGRTAMLYILAGINAERDTTANKTPVGNKVNYNFPVLFIK